MNICIVVNSQTYEYLIKHKPTSVATSETVYKSKHSTCLNAPLDKIFFEFLEGLSVFLGAYTMTSTIVDSEKFL